jgi:hypothetical protein
MTVSALRAQGLLATFGEAEVLAAADVHVASRLAALTGETDERVILAVALLVRGTRLGSVVLDLADAADTITADSDAEPVEPAALPWPELRGWVAARWWLMRRGDRRCTWWIRGCGSTGTGGRKRWSRANSRNALPTARPT